MYLPVLFNTFVDFNDRLKVTGKHGILFPFVF